MASGQQNNTSRNILLVCGCVLVCIGVFKLFENLFSSWWPSLGVMVNRAVSVAWPLAIVAAGAYIVYAVRKGTIAMPAGKRLFRRREDRMIGGVCSGIADYLGIDPTVVRVVFVVLLIGSFSAFLLFYIILWIVIPAEPQAPSSWQ